MTRVGVENEISSCFCITSRRGIDMWLIENGVLGLLSWSSKNRDVYGTVEHEEKMGDLWYFVLACTDWSKCPGCSDQGCISSGWKCMIDKTGCVDLRGLLTDYWMLYCPASVNVIGVTLHWRVNHINRRHLLFPSDVNVLPHWSASTPNAG